MQGCVLRAHGCAPLLIFLLLVACGVAGSPSAQEAAQSAWGTVLRLGQAEQSTAPTIAWSDNRVSFLWVGADSSGIHQDGRIWEAGALTETAVLPLPPRNPFGLQTLPAARDSLHQLWLDQNSAGELRLYSALLSLPLTVQRGPIEITEQATRRFAAVRLPDDGAWVVTSGGLEYAPALYAHRLDEEGRPRLENVYQVATEADYPALLIMPDSTLMVYWLGSVDGQVYRAALLPNGLLDTPQSIAPGLTLDPADRLESFHVAADQSHTYLFWNVVTAAGLPQTWYSAAPSASENWPAPRRVAVQMTDTAIAIGFNAGQVQVVEAGETGLGFVSPVPGIYPYLPTTAYDPAGQVGVLFWEGGEPVGLVEVAAARLIGPPQLAVDRALYLYLTWSAPNETGSADLLTASLRFNP
jgi:hypothetical protein